MQRFVIFAIIVIVMFWAGFAISGALNHSKKAPANVSITHPVTVRDIV